MPRLAGVRERRHQPFWDTLVRSDSVTAPSIQSTTRLFGNANVGQLALTNLQVAGQLASDQTYVILAMRCWLHFHELTGATAGLGKKLYQQVVSQLYWTLNVGDKPQFQAPVWYFPTGGGLFGFDASTGAGSGIYNLGMPTQEAIMKLARPIMVPVRQNFNVTGDFFKLGAEDAVTTINTANTVSKVISFMIDGLQTRDVQ